MSGITHRPLNYDSVIGSKPLVDLMKGSVASGVILTSYTISGPAGTGKTTLGRIFAKAILCQEHEDGSPCGECSSCRAMDNASHPSFMEVDAATSGNKDFIKHLVEMSRHESDSRFVILMDEAHEISSEGKDALLKTLEEEGSSSSMVIIFCTSEVDKMPPSLLQRGFEFMVPPTSKGSLTRKLAYICNQDKIPYTDAGISLLADCFDGSFRQAENALPMLGTIPGGVIEENVGKIAPVNLMDTADVLDALGSDARSAITIMAEMATRADARAIRTSMLKVLVDTLKYREGVEDFQGSYKLQLEHLSKKYSGFVLNMVGKLSSSQAFNNVSLLQADLLSLHYQFLFGTISQVQTEPNRQSDKKMETPVTGGTSTPQSNANSFWVPVRVRPNKGYVSVEEKADSKPEATPERSIAFNFSRD